MTEAEELELLELEEEEAQLAAAARAQPEDSVLDVGKRIANKAIQGTAVAALGPMSLALDLPQFETNRGTVAESVERGWDQGGSFGFSDEFGGAKAVMRGQDYVAGRDKERLRDLEAEETNPDVYRGAEIGSGVLSSIALPVGRGAKGLMGTGAALGAAGGVGLGTSDLTQGDAGGVLSEAALGGALGAAGGALAHGAGKFMGGLQKSGPAQWLRGKIVGAEEDALRAAAKAREGALNSARGRLGGAVAAGRNKLALANEIVSSPHSTPEQIARAQAFLDSPEAVSLARGVYDNALEEAPNAMGRISSERAALNEAVQGASPEEAAAESLKDPLRKQVLPRAFHIGQRLLPGAAGYITYEATDSPEVAGVVTGGLAVAQGRPGTVIRNLGKNPAVRKAWWEGLKSVLVDAPAKIGKWAPALSRALQRGEQAFAVEAYVLHEQEPEFRAAVEGLQVR